MIKSIIYWSIKNRLIVLIISFLITLLGLYSTLTSNVDAIPDLSDTQVIVKTSFPGQAPQVVENQITYPLSNAMLKVPGAKTVRGFSFFGDSYIYILFDEGVDQYWARSRVLEALSQISSELPSNAKSQLGPDSTGVGWIYQYALIDKTNQYDLSQLTSLQNWFLKYELQTIPNVSEVATIGGMVKQYQITININKLKAYSLRVKTVEPTVANKNGHSWQH